MTGRWISSRDLLRAAPVRLFCLPHAGSGAAGYYRWRRLLAGRVDVCPVLLPGREARLSEPCVETVDEMVAALMTEVELSSEPYAIFGHSMGALLGYAWAVALAEAGARAPECLFVSGREAADRGTGAGVLHTLPDAAFVEALRERYGRTTPGVLEEPELRELFLPILRADLKVVETYTHRAAPALKTAVCALAGEDDSSVSDAGLATWKNLTGDEFSCKRLPGDHFYHFGGGQGELLRIIETRLASPR